MKTELLNIPMKMHLEEIDKKEIDLFVENTIVKHKHNAAIISKLTLDSVVAITASEARSKQLMEQGFFKRIWGELSGKNDKIRNQIGLDISRTQYASMQILNKLSEQNLFTFELVTVVNNKLNSLILEVGHEMNEIYSSLIHYFKEIRSDLVRLESRVERLERNVHLLKWSKTIDYRMFDGLEYSELPLIDKLICVTNDFFQATKGNWDIDDILLLKSTLDNIGINSKEKIVQKEFFQHLIKHPSSIKRFFEGVPLDTLELYNSIEIPVVKGMEKIQLLNGDEHYVYHTLEQQLLLNKVPVNEQDLKLSLIQQYIKEYAFCDIQTEVNVFDFSLELLTNLLLISQADPIIEKVLEDVPIEVSLPKPVLNVEELNFTRDHFETDEEFKQRIEAYGDFIGGSTYLIAENYNVKDEIFRLTIEWNTALQNLITNSEYYYFKAPPQAAKSLYELGDQHPIRVSATVFEEQVIIIEPFLEFNSSIYKVEGGFPGRILKRIPVDYEYIIKIILNTSETAFAVISEENQIQVLDVHTGKVKYEDKWEESINNVSFLEDDVLIIETETSITKWNLETSERKSLNIPKAYNRNQSNNCRCIVQEHESVITIYDTDQLKSIFTFDYQNARILSYTFSPEEQKLFLVSAEYLGTEGIFPKYTDYYLRSLDIKSNKKETIGEIYEFNKNMFFSQPKCQVFIANQYIVCIKNQQIEFWNVKKKTCKRKFRLSSSGDVLENGEYTSNSLEIGYVQTLKNQLVFLKEKYEKFGFYYDIEKNTVVHKINIELPKDNSIHSVGVSNSSTGMVVLESKSQWERSREILILVP